MRNRLIPRRLAAWGPLVLRLGVASIFIGAGLQKLIGIWGGTGIAGTTRLFEVIHLWPAKPLAIAITALELVGGMLLAMGTLTEIVGGLLVVEMLVAIWKVHLVHGFFLNWGLRPGVGHGIEFNVLLIAALVCLAFIGPGKLSVDGWLQLRQKSVDSQ